MRHLLLSGGPGHDFHLTSREIAELLDAEGATTTIVEDPGAAVAALRDAEDGTTAPWDLLTVNALRWRMDQERFADQRDRWAATLTADDAAVIERHVVSGGGVLALHTAVICFDGHPTWRRLIGGAWSWDRSGHPPVGQVTVSPTRAGDEHPVTAGTGAFTLTDELYQRLDLDADVEPLLTAEQDDGAHPVLWTVRHGRGRVVTSLLGHGPESLAHPSHRALLVRAGAWAARSLTTAGGPST